MGRLWEGRVSDRTVICVVVMIAVATFDVDVRGPAWQVEALRATLVADLTSDRLQPGTPADLHVVIAIEGRELRYVVSRDGVPPVRGAIALGRDRRAVVGVLKDDLYRLAPKRESVIEDVELPPPVGSFGAFAVLALLAGLLAVPLVLRTRAAPRIVVAICGVGVAAYVIVSGGIADGVLFLAGGLAWGQALAACTPIALPPLAGMHRVEHREL